ncbi:MAG TPA: hypothetical protein VM513_32150, partial [Kofleriaceae bacterium]|nr:hypothetical protein [Kofleriaceae bacterium]
RLAVAPPAPTPQPAVEPPPPATVTLRFSVKPARATITVDGKLVENGELVVPRDGAKHALSIAAPGFKPVSEELTFDESQRLAYDLVRVDKPNRPRPTRPTRPNKPDRIDPDSPYK